MDIQNKLAWLVCVATLSLPTAATLATEPLPVPGFSATYQVRYGLLGGELSLELSHLDPGYLYQTSLSPTGIVSWFKRGAITERTTLLPAGETVRPIDYYNQDTIADPIRNTQYQFDYRNDRVTGQYKTQTIDEPMRPDGHNRISVQIALLLALRSNTDISTYSVFDRGRWREYQFELIHGQTVETQSGNFETVEVRYSAADDDKSWSIQFAKDLSYLPVVFLYHEDGELKSRAQIIDYSIEGTELSRRD